MSYTRETHGRCPTRTAGRQVAALIILGFVLVACSSPSSDQAEGGSAPDAQALDATSVLDATMDGSLDAADGPAVEDASTASDAGGDDGDPGEDGGALADAADCDALGPSGEPGDLRCAGLYSDWATKTVAPGVTPFTPGLPLWSDGAVKTRWIQLPAGQKIDTSTMDEWTFPVGTRFWKEFRLPLGDAATPVRIETRLLWKNAPGSWVRTTYRWSADGETSAPELLGGELDVNGTGYEVPSQFECNYCHNGRLDGVLGFEAVALSAPGASGLTMQQLVASGLLTNPPASPVQVPGNAVESAALGWLHMNCGTACHNRDHGAAADTGFYMRLDVATLASVASTDTYRTGWNQVTTGFAIPDASVTYRLHACDLGNSAVHVRDETRTGLHGAPPNIQMPPLDTHAVDLTGVAAVSAWIQQGCDGG